MEGFISEIIKHVGEIDSTAAVVLILAAFIVIMLFTLQKSQDKREERRAAAEDKREERRMTFEERRARNQENTNSCLQQTLQEQHQLLAQNSEAVHGLARTLESMNDAFQMVSRQVAVNDRVSERTNHMIENIQQKMPDEQTIKRIHDRIDTFGEVFPSKEDVENIRHSITELDEKVSRANSVLAEIRTRQLSR